MRTILSILVVCLAAGCGSEIGDSCTFDSECSPTGDRICASGADLPGGYCTMYGCDYDTCPDEAVCIRFFALGSTNLSCVSADDCGRDELCTLGGYCVPRTAEIRYCMKTCSDDGDCRDGYHCRTRELMEEYGGEPVPVPGESLGENVTGFCAYAAEF